MATKSKQLGVRLDLPQVKRLDEIAERYAHTQAGLIRLAVDQLIKAYDADGQLRVQEEAAEYRTAGGAR